MPGGRRVGSPNPWIGWTPTGSSSGFRAGGRWSCDPLARRARAMPSGRCSSDLRPAVAFMLGDDRTDVAAFRVLRAARDAGEIQGAAIAVGADPDRLEATGPHADVVLGSPDDAARFLVLLLRALPVSRRSRRADVPSGARRQGPRPASRQAPRAPGAWARSLVARLARQAPSSRLLAAFMVQSSIAPVICGSRPMAMVAPAAMNRPTRVSAPTTTGRACSGASRMYITTTTRR